MSDERALHDDAPHQDWTGGAPRLTPEQLQALHEGYAEAQRERVMERIRDTLEESGIPFLRACHLAERCNAALKELIP